MLSVCAFLFVYLFPGAKGKDYGTFHEEAVRVFSSLLEQESIADPIPVIQVRYLVHVLFFLSQYIFVARFFDQWWIVVYREFFKPAKI